MILPTGSSECAIFALPAEASGTPADFQPRYNIRKLRTAGRPELKEEHVAIRLDWEIEHLDQSERQWTKIIFAAERAGCHIVRPCSIARAIKTR